MKKIKIKPPEATDLTLGHYQEFYLGTKDIKEDEDAINRHLISTFCELDSSIIDLLQGKQVDQLVNALSHIVLNQEWKLVRTFTMGEIEFGFIPDIDEASFGEWVDIDTYLTDVSNWHKLMAVIFRPIKHKRPDKKLGTDRYNIVEYQDTKQYAEAMKLMPMDAALGAISFFERLGMDLLKVIPSYLDNQIASQLQVPLKDSEENGGGTDLSINSVEETLSQYRELVNSACMKPSSFFHFHSTKQRQKKNT